MLYLPSKVSSAYESKIVYIPNYTIKIKSEDNISNEDLKLKAKELSEQYTKDGYYCRFNTFRSEIIDNINHKNKNSFKIFDCNINYKNKTIHINMTDKQRCYCINCKKMISAKIETFQYKLRGNLYYPDYVYTCPCCNKSVPYYHLRQSNNKYALFNECFLEGNKLRIRHKNIEFKEFNNRVFIETNLEVLIMNLDTGMTYLLPTMKNGKINKKQSIKNVSYNSDLIPYFNIDRYSDKCKNIKDIYKKAFNIIREYKIKKNNFYIPTLKEQMDFAILKGVSKKSIFGHKYIIFSEYEEDDKYFDIDLKIDHLMKLNRFSSMNIFFNNLYYLDLNLINIDNKDYNKIKKLRGQIKENSTNPIKDLVEKMNAPYSKKLRTYYEKNISLILFYKSLSDLGIKKDNILKLFDLTSNSRIDTVLQLIKSYTSSISIIRNFKTYNENNFVNKIINFVSKDSRNFTTVIDMLNIIERITSYNDQKDYSLDLRLDLKSLHDIVSSDFKKIKIRNNILNYTKEELKVNGTFNNLHFALAKDTYELIDVGTKMNICVGSYDEKAIKRECFIVIARNNDNEPIICIEIDKHFLSLEQSKLKYNAYPEEDSEEYKAILEWCNHANMLPINYEINSYLKSKAFLLEHKDLVAKYNTVASSYHKIKLEETTLNEVAETDVDNYTVDAADNYYNPVEATVV